MAQVTKTELNQQTAKVLARVARGERLTVTDRGVPIAEISQPRADAWEQLVASGRVRGASRSGPLLRRPGRSSEQTSAILDDLRADRA